MIVFLLLIIIVVILILIEIQNSNKSNANPNLKITQILKDNSNSQKLETSFPTPTSTSIRYTDFYKPKRYLITLAELNFYNILNEIAKELNLVVFSQVSMYNIVDVKDTPYKNTAFNKIRSKSIDFVLTDTKSCRILLCIELDDYTHKYYKKRIERDKFLQEIFASLEINFIRFDVSNYYNKELLKSKIENAIKNYHYA